MNATLQTSLDTLFDTNALSAAAPISDPIVRELNDFEVLCAGGGETLVNFG